MIAIPPRTALGTVSRRTALRGLGGAGLAALGVAALGRAAAADGDRHAAALFGPDPAPGGDPVAVVAAYAAAVNAGDLEGILALYADDAVHVALPAANGSGGVCLGKAQFRMWYAQSLANGDGVEVEDGTLAVDGNQAAFAARLASDPWRALGIEALEANAQLVVADGRIVTHVVALTPESVRRLAAARGAAAAAAAASGDAWASTRRQPGRPH